MWSTEVRTCVVRSAWLLLLALILVPQAGEARTVALARQATDGDDETSLYKSMRWRNVGPFRGGRAVAAAGVPDDRLTYYMGTAGGGVWKTADGGISWRKRHGRLRRHLVRGRRGRLRVRPERGLRRNGRALDPRRHDLTRRWGLPLHRRGPHLDAHGARPDAGHLAHPDSSRRPGSRIRRRAGFPLLPHAGARHLPLGGRRRELGTRPPRGRETPVPRISPWTGPTRACSTPRCGTTIANPGTSGAAAPVPASGSRRTAGIRGRRSTRASPR